MALRRMTTITAGLTLTVLGLSACGGGASEAPAGDGQGSAGAGQKKEITIGYIPWDEDIAVTHLWERVLTDKGYTVTTKQLDVAPTFVGLAQGDIDLYLDGWLPVTHEDYWKKYGDKIEDVQTWYDNAKLTIAVPEYMTDVKSIADLKGKGNTFKGRIIGIEPGAGLTRVTKDAAMPKYGLDGEYQLVTSSTAAMLAELKKATDAKEPIVVTLWRPHWAYDKFPIRDLEDPEGAMGEAEQIKALGREGFGKDYPEVDAMLKKFTMDDKELGSLENLVLQENKDDPAKGVEEWLKEYPDFVTSLD
ncbi:glycine betaine ABC transporter substrate-binding protein [Gephyromycinifex aptenodytis]|uniref:glycine betaine ABC transporter substrate-binding protein n=1 Tax=Gephyromycinifex aptenodytis TaxID=2716227 RepID=UPI0014487089|nr:glycine betaine ABC transporter substrate-binding protein [Gephyromycinifex aptenodytis]